MAGLLDFLATPESQLGIGLLAAANSGQGFGQGLLSAMNTVSGRQQEQMKNKLLQSQIDENSSQADIRRQQLALAQQKQSMLQNLFGAGGNGPLSGVSTGGGLNVSPTVGGLDIGNMSVNQIAALKANGIDVESLWKTSKEGFKRDAGAYYQDVNGGEKFYPQLDKGMAVQDGRVTVAPGYAQSNANIKGSEAAAVAAANYPYTVGIDAARQNLAANLDPVTTYNSQLGRSELVPRSAVVGSRPVQNMTGPGYAGGSSGNAANEQMRIIQSELDRLPANHPDRPAIMRELQRLGAQAPAQSGNYAAGPSASEAAANEARRVQAVEQTKADITPTAQKLSAVTTARDALGVIDQALQHPGLKTSTGLSGSMDPRNYIPGTDATNFRVLMDQIRGGVFLDAYKDLRGGGAITEVEGQKAEAAKARINRAQSPDEFVKGLQEYRAIVDRGYERARQQLPASTGGASGSWDATPQAQQAPRATMRFNPQTGRLEKVN